jgi:transposase InsO family protein
LVWLFEFVAAKGLPQKRGERAAKCLHQASLSRRGDIFIRRLQPIGIRDRLTAARSPWQNGYAERPIGSIRRDRLDYVAVFGEWLLRHLLESYQKYYNEARTHLSLSKDAPVSRAVQVFGGIVAKPLLGGLHRQCVRI